MIDFNRFLSNGIAPQKTMAIKGGIEAILIWKMDRLNRGGIRDTFNQIDYFKSRGISLISITEPFLSTDNSSAELILAVLAWAAEQESKNISARVKAGLERVKAEGQRLGRPTVPKLTEKWILDLAKNNPHLNLREITNQVPPYYTKTNCPRKLSHVSVKRVLQKYGIKLSMKDYSKKVVGTERNDKLTTREEET